MARRTRDLRDNDFSPRRGVWINTEATFAVGEARPPLPATGLAQAQFQSFSFAKIEGTVIAYIPLFGAVLTMTAKAGHAAAIDGDGVPVDERFLLGGRDTLRGFVEDTLVPEDGCITDPADTPGCVISVPVVSGIPLSRGGHTFVLLRTELRVPIAPRGVPARTPALDPAPGVGFKAPCARQMSSYRASATPTRCPMTNARSKPQPKAVRWESGIEIKPVYGPADIDRSGGADGIGTPGEYPYTRGIHPFMYRSRPFTMRQYSGFGTAAQTHERFAYLIHNGQTGLNVAFDLPTQCGYDSDDPMAAGEVGRVGMAVDSLADIEEAFADIPLNEITVSLTINGAAVPIMAMYFAMARKRGYDWATLRGTAQNDILKEFIGRGTWIFPVDASMQLVADTMEFCAQQAPKYSPVSVCGYHIRESGATPAQEMAYGLAIAKAYVERGVARGLSGDQCAGGITFNFDIHGNLWEQVAKFRAGRRLWARITKEQLGVTKPRAMQLRMIAGGGGGGLTIQEPMNNIVRGAYYALASALSGTQTMALCSYDEAYTIPSKEAARISLRTMQLLIHEIGLSDTVDPLAGSYFVETMTNEMEQLIVSLMERIDNAGGIVEGVASGSVQAEVNRQAYERERKIQSGEHEKVGVNCCVDADGDDTTGDVEMHPYYDAQAQEQIARLEKIRTERDGSAVTKALAAVEAAARAGDNVMPAVIDAVERYATVGEICTALREVYGAYDEPLRM